MDLSLYLCRFFGIYLLIIATLHILRKDYISDVVDDYFKNPASLFTAMIFTFILGLFLVLAHNIWEGTWRSMVTLLCYLTLLKGLVGLFAPDFTKTLKNKLLKSHLYYVFISFWMVVGIYLVYEGFLVANA